MRVNVNAPGRIDGEMLPCDARVREEIAFTTGLVALNAAMEAAAAAGVSGAVEVPLRRREPATGAFLQDANGNRI
jgi:hypothetical protein